jgi:hypothetical protein
MPSPLISTALASLLIGKPAASCALYAASCSLVVLISSPLRCVPALKSRLMPCGLSDHDMCGVCGNRIQARPIDVIRLALHDPVQASQFFCRQPAALAGETIQNASRAPLSTGQASHKATWRAGGQGMPHPVDLRSPRYPRCLHQPHSPAQSYSSAQAARPSRRLQVSARQTRWSSRDCACQRRFGYHARSPRRCSSVGRAAVL